MLYCQEKVGIETFARQVWEENGRVGERKKYAQQALAADVARRGEKWLKLRFFVYGKMLAGKSRVPRG